MKSKRCTCRVCGKPIDNHDICEDCYYDIESEINQLKRLYSSGLRI